MYQCSTASTVYISIEIVSSNKSLLGQYLSSAFIAAGKSNILVSMFELFRKMLLFEAGEQERQRKGERQWQREAW